jgi:hypothetical protein
MQKFHCLIIDSNSGVDIPVIGSHKRLWKNRAFSPLFLGFVGL